MQFKKGSPLYATEIERRQGEDVIYVNTIGAPFVPSVAESPNIMSLTIDILTENPNVSRVVFVQQRNYSYPSSQILLLSEIARLYNFLVKQEELLSPRKLSLFGNQAQVAEDIRYLIILLKQDPVSCFLELKKRIKNLKAQLEKGEALNRSGLINYIRSLERFHSLLEETELLKKNERIRCRIRIRK